MGIYADARHEARALVAADRVDVAAGNALFSDHTVVLDFRSATSAVR